MPNLPQKHNASKRKRISNNQTVRRQAKRYLSTSSARWRAIATDYLNRHPLCVMCEQDGQVTAATDVDHINGRSDRPEDYQEDNYQALCKSCHSRKTRTEQMR